MLIALLETDPELCRFFEVAGLSRDVVRAEILPERDSSTSGFPAEGSLPIGAKLGRALRRLSQSAAQNGAEVSAFDVAVELLGHRSSIRRSLDHRATSLRRFRRMLKAYTRKGRSS